MTLKYALHALCMRCSTTILTASLLDSPNELSSKADIFFWKSNATVNKSLATKLSKTKQSWELFRRSRWTETKTFSDWAARITKRLGSLARDTDQVTISYNIYSRQCASAEKPMQGR